MVRRASASAKPGQARLAFSAGSSHSGSAGRPDSASPIARTSTFPREAGGHRIDRLDQRQAGEVRLADDVVGMDHGRPAVEPFDPAADVAGLADRQRLLQPCRRGRGRR